MPPRKGLLAEDKGGSQGFLALGYEKTLYVIDLRGPRIILRHPCTKRKSGGIDSYTVLSWSICGLNGEPVAYCDEPQFRLYYYSAESTSPSLHLFAGTASGIIQVFTFIPAQGSWSVDPHVLTLQPIDNLTNLTTLIVVDAETGEELTASPERLLAAMRGTKAKGVYQVVATATEVRCMDGVSMKRIARATFPVGAGVGVEAKRIGIVRHVGELLGWTWIGEERG